MAKSFSVSPKFITTAILSRRKLRFVYNDRQREVAPFLLGYKNNDELVLVAWQTKGSSESKDKPMWRNFRVDQMTRMELMQEGFVPVREGYNREDKTMKRIVTRI